MRVIIFSLFALLSSAMAVADDHNNPHKGQFYVSPGAVLYTGPDDSNIGYEDTEVGAGLILGYGLSDNWSVEVMGARVEAEFDNRFGASEDDVSLVWLDFVYNLEARNAWQPFILFGGGRSEYEFDDVRPDSKDNQLNLGAGVYRQLTDHISFRADVRGVTSTKEGGLEPFAFIGLTGFIGSAPAPLPPADSDGDGVPNDMDKCPTTPAGRVVDASGCQLDGDNDGVVDAIDQCPETPAGVAVDSKGCALDTDGDGVPDYRDDCPGSEAGAKVDAKGCYVELEEEVTIDINIEFESNKADILAEHNPELNRVVEFLRQYPTANASIEGHTDSDGAEAYNQSLSERRALAVYSYLVNEAGVDADRLTSAGFGESQPLVPNDSAENKRHNRRVHAVVAGTQTVRQ